MPAAAAASSTGRGAGPPPSNTASNSASAAAAAGSVSALANCAATSDVYRRPDPNRLIALGNSATSKPVGDVQLDGCRSRRARCAPAPAARRCDTAATPAASCPARRGGHGWPPRWRSARRRSARRPWVHPWFPTSSPPGPRRRRCLPRRAGPRAAHPSRGRAATSAGSRPSSTRSRAGNSDEMAEPGGTVSARSTAMPGPRPHRRRRTASPWPPTAPAPARRRPATATRR